MALAKDARNTLLDWIPISPRLLEARLDHRDGQPTIIDPWTSNDPASDEDKDIIYQLLKNTRSWTIGHHTTLVPGDLYVTTDCAATQNCVPKPL